MNAPDPVDLFEIMHTTRAMRRLKPDPVPDALIRKILEAGGRPVTARPGGAPPLPGHPHGVRARNSTLR